MTETAHKHVIKQYLSTDVPGEAERERTLLLALEGVRGVPEICKCPDPSDLVMSYEGMPLLDTVSIFKNMFLDCIPSLFSHVAADGVSAYLPVLFSSHFLIYLPE